MGDIFSICNILKIVFSLYINILLELLSTPYLHSKLTSIL